MKKYILRLIFVVGFALELFSVKLMKTKIEARLMVLSTYKFLIRQAHSKSSFNDNTDECIIQETNDNNDKEEKSNE